MKIIVAYRNHERLAAIRHAFDHAARVMGLPSFDPRPLPECMDLGGSDCDILITYSSSIPDCRHPRRIHIYESPFFGDAWFTGRSLPPLPLSRFEDLPVLFDGRPGDAPWVEVRPGLVQSRADIPAGIFFLISRYEETLVPERDRFQRFPSDASILVQSGILERPLADEYSLLLASWITELCPDFRLPALWGRRPFVLHVTHDVDVLRKYTWKKALGLRVPPLRALRTLLGDSPDPWWTFPEIQVVHKRLGIRPDYFLPAGGTHVLDRSMNLRFRDASALLDLLEDSECGLGIHFSLSAHLSLMRDENTAVFARELESFRAVAGRDPAGSRQHYLGFSIPETWRVLDRLGIPFDATLGFPERPGFRCGTCHPFRAFDLKACVPLGLVEIPLIAMDTTYLHYRGTSPAEALAGMKSLLSTVRKCRGVMSVLWHNNTLSREDHPGWSEAFADFLDHAVEQGPLAGNPLGSS